MRELLDRGWGKATQIIGGDEERPIAIDFTWAPALEAGNMGNEVTLAVAKATVIDAVLADSRPPAAQLVLEWENCEAENAEADSDGVVVRFRKD
jgi:hypothetical protein